MKIDITLLKKLEKLSHLTIDESKREEMVSQLSDIVDYVDSLSELDTSNIDSHFSTLTGGTPLREDTPTISTDISQSIIGNSPHSIENLFIVPAIIE